jgi:hypothetical protein
VRAVPASVSVVPHPQSTPASIADVARKTTRTPANGPAHHGTHA